MARTSDVILSLGSNKGDRRGSLHEGLVRLKDAGFLSNRTSPVVESPALLPPNSPSQWNRPYLNLVVQGSTSLDLDSFSNLTKKIQSATGTKDPHSRWAPRDLDIDLVSWGDEVFQFDGTTLPDAEVYLKPYVLSPLVHMKPDFRFPGMRAKSVLELSCERSDIFHIPLWMGIVNLTPDSFSDGGIHCDPDKVGSTVEQMIEDGAGIIDLGAESTRPNATPVSHEEEWNRLSPALESVLGVCESCLFPPQISIDTYHPETALKAVQSGVDVINDVGGLGRVEMLDLAKSSDCTFVAMHSVSIPVDPSRSIDPDSDACEVFEAWLEERQRTWDKVGLDLSRVIIDPGIGFGKSSLQSLRLMRSVRRLRSHGFRLLIGHSRKSFLKTFSSRESSQSDPETVGASIQLCSQSVDILRVHDINSHIRAYLSWAHLLGNTV
ncbi:MAG: dihydropteroate synthase [Acidiferrobacterales bacterium]|nr:dihydropteroate synthase [Acidiferrobacterales bacterium]